MDKANETNPYQIDWSFRQFGDRVCEGVALVRPALAAELVEAQLGGQAGGIDGHLGNEGHSSNPLLTKKRVLIRVQVELN